MGQCHCTPLLVGLGLAVQGQTEHGPFVPKLCSPECMEGASSESRIQDPALIVLEDFQEHPGRVFKH